MRARWPLGGTPHTTPGHLSRVHTADIHPSPNHALEATSAPRCRFLSLLVHSYFWCRRGRAYGQSCLSFVVRPLCLYSMPFLVCG